MGQKRLTTTVLAYLQQTKLAIFILASYGLHDCSVK